MQTSAKLYAAFADRQQLRADDVLLGVIIFQAETPKTASSATNHKTCDAAISRSRRNLLFGR